MKKLIFLILMLATIHTSSFAVSENESNNSLYKTLLMTDGSYVILENITKDITKQFTSCSSLNMGVKSFPGDSSASPSTCWVVGQWSGCSTTCGTGTKTRTTACFNLDKNVSSDCDLSIKPSTEEGCFSDTSCSYQWIASEWEQCPTTCGEAMTTRAVQCAKDGQNIVEDVFCDVGARPETSKTCQSYEMCSVGIRASSDDTSTIYISNSAGDAITKVRSIATHAVHTFSIDAKPDENGYIWIRVDWRNNSGPGGMYLQNTSTSTCFEEHSLPGKTGEGRPSTAWYNGPCWDQASATNKSHTWLYKYKVY